MGCLLDIAMVSGTTIDTITISTIDTIITMEIIMEITINTIDFKEIINNSLEHPATSSSNYSTSITYY